MRDIDMKANAVNNIRTSAIAYRIVSSAIDRCCKHAMLALEAAVMMVPVMLLPDLMPLTSRVALLAVLVLLPSREHGNVLIIRLGNVYACTVEGSHGLFVKLLGMFPEDAALRVTRVPGRVLSVSIRAGYGWFLRARAHYLKGPF